MRNKDICICQYCNKSFIGTRPTKFHEIFCKSNPNRKIGKGNLGKTKGMVPWNKGLTKETDERLLNTSNTVKNKIKEGIIPTFKNKKHSEESKCRIAKGRKKFLKDNPDKHPWKSNNKFISKPCEDFKSILKNKGILYEEEYTPIDSHNYSLDIAFPDIKLGIEINGNQHYNKDKSLKEYYQRRHNILVESGWVILEIHYSRVYSDSENILKEYYKYASVV